MDEKPPGRSIPIPTSTQKSLSSSHDPGWNDPPKWGYSQSPNASGTPPKRVLNKRVAFPLSSTPPTSNFDPHKSMSPPPANMPPPPLTSLRLNTVSNQVPIAGAAEQGDGKDFLDISKEQAIMDCLENFESVINEIGELKSWQDEIRRRLKLMETAWIEDKLDESIRRKVFELSNALRKDDVETADKIHVSLMMDHAALCSSWISGIRTLIIATRSKKVQENPWKVETTSPYFLPCENVRETE